MDELSSVCGHTLFVPLTFRLSLHLEQVTWQEMLLDPNLASFSIRATSGLFQADAFVNWFDEWMESESLGVLIERDRFGRGTLAENGNIDVLANSEITAGEPCRLVLDVTERLCAEVGDQTAVLGYITGGATLLARLYGHEEAKVILEEVDNGKLSTQRKIKMDVAVKASVDLVNAYCDRGIGAILIAEHDTVVTYNYLNLFSPVFNLCKYFRVPIFLVSRSPVPAETIEMMEKLGIHFVGPSSNGIPDVHVITEKELCGEQEINMPEAMKKRFVFTEWDLATDTDPAALSAVRTRILNI